MKNPVIAMKLYRNLQIEGTHKVALGLPDGCVGVLFCFNSKTKAKKCCGKEIETLVVEFVEQNVNNKLNIIQKKEKKRG